MKDLLRRQRAVNATLTKYRDMPFDWRKGATCLHLARFHLKKMGHRPEKLPRIRSMLAARRALDVRSWADTGDMLATMLPEITPAEMLLGDIAVLKSGDDLGAITISLGGKVMGWHEDYPGMTALEPLSIARAFRA